MFIPARSLRRLSRTLAALAAALLLFAPFPGPTAPVWVDFQPGPGLGYIADYEQGPAVRAASAILIEAATGTVLYAKNEHAARPMASTTKIMTALLALENSGLEEMVTVSSRATRVTGSDAGLRPGQRLTMRELLHGLLLPSGNDAANAVAEHVSGSQPAFVAMMNERAQQLGATRTRFANPHGLDAPGHYSTAYDLALIARTALLFPTFGQIVQTPEFRPESISRTWRNTNRLLWSFDGIEGVKTGTTSGAGYCLVAAASRGGMRLISVVLDSPDRWQDTVRLLEYGFDQFHLLTLASHGDTIAEANVPGGLGTLAAVVDGDFRVVVRDRDVNNLEITVALDDIRPPVRAGQPVGRLEIAGGSRTLQSVPLIAREDVPRWTLWAYLARWIQTHIL
ncbi:MAG: D-alanyl-D-alanine carboxypeptidase [Firmicutes bacterium]|nr:D-alanyl-D-alanine carboxypeptidase [Bacillota bacterium]